VTAAILAMLCALVYGTADFCGGMAAKRSRVLSVVALSQLAGMLLIIVLLPLLPGRPDAAGLLWGLGAGVAGVLGLVLFYRALAIGVMSVVAPTTAVTSAALPVLFGLVSGERPAVMALIGVALALLSVLMVSRNPAAGGSTSLPALLAALAAGAGFGGFFIMLAQVPSGAGLWPLLAARVASVGIIVLAAVLTRRSLRPSGGSLAIITTAGVLDMAANILFLLAEQQGMLSLVAVLVSLYPATTLVLARYVLGERLHAVQLTGVACALGSVALIAAA